MGTWSTNALIASLVEPAGKVCTIPGAYQLFAVIRDALTQVRDTDGLSRNADRAVTDLQAWVSQNLAHADDINKKLENDTHRIMGYHC